MTAHRSPSCPDDDALLRYLDHSEDARATATDRAAASGPVADHLQRCPACLARLRALRDSAERLRHAPFARIDAELVELLRASPPHWRRRRTIARASTALATAALLALAALPALLPLGSNSLDGVVGNLTHVVPDDPTLYLTLDNYDTHARTLVHASPDAVLAGWISRDLDFALDDSF